MISFFKMTALSVTFATIIIALPTRAQTFFGEHKEGTLCKAGEQIIFACDTKKKKVAVCARSQNQSSFGYFRYRYGTPTVLELSFPGKPSRPSTCVSGNILTAGERATLGYLTLRNKSITYSVFQEIISPKYAQSTKNSADAKIAIPGSTTGGIVVQEKGHILSKIMCLSEKPVLFSAMVDPGILGSAVPLDHHGLAGFPNYRNPGLNGDSGTLDDNRH